MVHRNVVVASALHRGPGPAVLPGEPLALDQGVAVQLGVVGLVFLGALTAALLTLLRRGRLPGLGRSRRAEAERLETYYLAALAAGILLVVCTTLAAQREDRSSGAPTGVVTPAPVAGGTGAPAPPAGQPAGPAPGH